VRKNPKKKKPLKKNKVEKPDSPNEDMWEDGWKEWNMK
jgi:hypothetical protein